MSKHRTILTAVALVVLTGISLAAAVQALVLGIPESSHPDRSPLVMLLATRDVMEQPEPSRRSLAVQLEGQLRRNVDWLSEVEQLDQDQRDQFVANVAELAKIAFLDKVDGYFRQRDERRRDQYLDRQLRPIISWAAVLDEKLAHGEKPALGPAAIMVVIAKYGELHRQSNYDQRRRIAKFQTELQRRAIIGMQRGMGINQP